MAVFAYKAVRGDAGVIRGTIVADTPRQARDRLRADGLDIRSVVSQEPKHRARPVRLFVRRHEHRVTAFVRELSTLLGVGIPLLEAIDTTVRSAEEGSFKAVLLTLRDRVAGGASLAEAMREHPALFDALCTNIVEVGEQAGTLEASLTHIAEFKETAQQLRGKIGTALLYPLIVLGMGLIVSVFLMTAVVPSLLQALIEAGRPLPTSTRIVQATSDFLIGHWWLLLGGMAVVLIAFQALNGTPKGQRAWHGLLLKIPLLGELIRKQAVVRLSLVISTLMRSGIPFDRALRTARQATSNRILADALRRCEDAVGAGRDIGQALEATDAFPPAAVQVFTVGQRTGRLEEMLDRLSADYDRQVATTAHRLTTVLEPILILALAVLVGLIAFATVMPILEAGDVL